MRIRLSSEKLFIFSYFTGIILIGSLALMLPFSWRGPGPLRYIDALFTSTSAVCVTGLITVDTALYTRFGQAAIVLLIQFGGLGIITFATIFIALPRKRISLVNRSVIKDYYIDEVEYNPKSMVRGIVGATLVVEGAGAALLYLRFRHLDDGLFVSVFHSVSAFCNAGFSTFSDNLEGYVADPLVNLAVVALIFLGGIGFLVMRDVVKRLRGDKRRLSYHSRVAISTSAALVAFGSLAFYLLESRHAMSELDAGGKALASLFQAVTPRTAGFDTILQSRLSAPSVLITILLMFIGASPGSTGGGVKTTTFFVLVMAAFRGTDERDRLNIGNRSIPARTIIKALGVLGKGIAIILVSAGLLLVLERGTGTGARPGVVQAIFEAVSAFGTVGLSLGITANLAASSKLVLILTMFAGRVGLFAMSIPMPGRKLERYVELPGTDVLIG